MIQLKFQRQVIKVGNSIGITLPKLFFKKGDSYEFLVLRKLLSDEEKKEVEEAMLKLGRGVSNEERKSEDNNDCK